MSEFEFSNYYNDEYGEYRFDIYTGDFNNIPSSKVSQVYGIIYNDINEILLVKNRNKDWILPGGRVEIGESYLQTLNRELYEESATYINQQSVLPCYYQHAYKKQVQEWISDIYQLRYFAKFAKADKFVSDPDGGISEICWQDIEKLEQKLKWQGVANLIQTKYNELIIQ
jgi:ADP-ribose pyrophosphatase YjhB (NUDIX family)